MTYYFISDDIMFLQGTKEITKEFAGESLFLNPNEGLRYFSPKKGDTIILAVDNYHFRSLLMRIAYKKLCRLLILFDMPVLTKPQAYFPWLASKKIKIDRFLFLIKKSRCSPLCYSSKNISKKMTDIFVCLGNGEPMEIMEKNHDITAKYIYQTKRNILRKYGFMNCNALAVLFCKDLLEIYRF